MGNGEGKGLSGWWHRVAPGSFMNTADEWHAVVYGFGEGFFPLALLRGRPEPEYVRLEPHYYRWGQSVGFGALVGVLTVATWWVRGCGG